MSKYCWFIILWCLYIQVQSFFFLLFLWNLLPSPTKPDPLVGPLSVLYIYNEIQIHISRTVSTPRVTVWILLTLISWIMLIFTLPAHRQQTPHDMAVVTAVSVCCRVFAVCVFSRMCMLDWLPCCQTDLHVKRRSNYITYVNERRTYKCTYAPLKT